MRVLHGTVFVVGWLVVAVLALSFVSWFAGGWGAAIVAVALASVLIRLGRPR